MLSKGSYFRQCHNILPLIFTTLHTTTIKYQFLMYSVTSIKRIIPKPCDTGEQRNASGWQMTAKRTIIGKMHIKIIINGMKSRVV